MEAAVATPEAPPEPEASHDGTAEATRTTEELFQWSGYVHLGQRAEDCEHAVDGECADPGHFHSWVCLPNAFQARDIGDKARAAKARRVRALRDPESDSYAVLETDLDEVRRNRYGELIDALARKRTEQLLPDFVQELNGEERFEHYAQDAEELRRLRELPEDERDEEEYERLQADMLAYAEEFQKKIDARIEVEIEALKKLPEDAVIAEERDSRIEVIGTEQYLWTWYLWARYVCAREPTTTGFPSRRKFAKPEDLHHAPPEVVDGLREKLRELETRTAMRGEAAGN